MNHSPEVIISLVRSHPLTHSCLYLHPASPMGEVLLFQ
jgi:hypothetical protein